jgi:integrase
LNYSLNGRERRMVIGAFPNWTTTAARQEARRLKQLVDQGIAPLSEREQLQAAPTVAALCDRFEAEHLPRKRPSTARYYKMALARYVRPFFGKSVKVSEVSFADIDALHRRISKTGARHTANRVIAVLSKMFALAIKWEMRTTNPVKNIERNTEHHRRRYLNADELVRLTDALARYPEQQAADAIRILLLTGARRGEVLSMKWTNVDFKEGVWSKPASSVKQNQPHTVPLSGPARQVLSKIWNDRKATTASEFVFPGNGESGHRVELKDDWRRLCEAAGIEDLRIHDLRHSFASQLASGGASLPLIGALLGHSQPATTQRYAHLFQDPLREAVEKVGAVVTGAPIAETVALLPAKKR